MIHSMGNGYEFSDETGEVLHSGTVVLSLSGIRKKILCVLMNEEQNKIVSRSEITLSVWGKSDETLLGASLTQQIYLLRKDLEKIGIQQFIISHSKAGYNVRLLTGENPQEWVDGLKPERKIIKFNF